MRKERSSTLTRNRKQQSSKDDVSSIRNPSMMIKPSMSTLPKRTNNEWDNKNERYNNNRYEFQQTSTPPPPPPPIPTARKRWNI